MIGLDAAARPSCVIGASVWVSVLDKSVCPTQNSNLHCYIVLCRASFMFSFRSLSEPVFPFLFFKFEAMIK